MVVQRVQDWGQDPLRRLCTKGCGAVMCLHAQALS